MNQLALREQTRQIQVPQRCELIELVVREQVLRRGTCIAHWHLLAYVYPGGPRDHVGTNLAKPAHIHAVDALGASARRRDACPRAVYF